ncbi:MAG: HDOD domain-containing protein [Amphritea sp.]
MSTAQSPQDAIKWVNFLVNKQLPIRVSTQTRLQKKINQSNSSLIELNKLIKADPILCLHVASLAGKLHREKSSEITSIDHAINSLGMNRLEQLIASLPIIRLSASSVADKMYFRAIANSHHAATQTREWLNQSRGGLFSEESFLAAMFYGVGHWALWHFAPLHMSEIQKKIRDKGIDPEQAERAILGCTVARISKGLVERWHVSPLALATLEQDSPLNKQTLTQLHQRALGDPRLLKDELRSLNHLTQQKFFPVKLANWLAWAAPYGWQTDKTLHIVDIINDYLKSQLAKTLSVVHKNCALSARQYHVIGTLSPAAEMLMIQSSHQAGYKLSPAEQKKLIESNNELPLLTHLKTAPSPGNINEAQPETELLDHLLFQQISEKLLKQPEQYTQASEAINDLLNAITLGIGLPRASVSIIPPQSNTLKVIQAQGFPPGHPLINSSHKLESDSLFLLLYKQSACILVNDTNQKRISKVLPESYACQINENGYLMMSIFVHNKPLAIIYADAGKQTSGIQSSHQEKFKYLCNAASTCLSALTKTKQARA